MTPAQAASPLAGRAYDPAALGSVSVARRRFSGNDVAEQAGRSVDVLVKVYAECIAGQETTTVNQRITGALRGLSE
ncbi:hypothetical protein AB0J86_19565 [Micromonospora sp. NPDC049559]|uniref:hypothetical protein n=1 Tax=Micromonospora sp. NPDC049559 TaxID=3155923 RepID=UPI003421E14D